MSQIEQKELLELVRKQEDDYITGVTNIGKYVEFSQHENIEKIDAYLNSKHISGEQDSLGRDKPFFNIVTAAVNIWYRATDIDRKNIKIKATEKSHVLLAFVATILLQEWMRRNAFGQFLNSWGRSLARYGSTVLKFVEKGGELIPSVIPWNRMISDTVDFEHNPKIETLWMTPAQLLNNPSYDQEIVEKLLDTIEARKTVDGQNKDNKSEYIKLYEVHGELPLSYLTGKDKDINNYVQQMHVVTYVAKKAKGQFDDFCLYSGREAKDPYKLTHLIAEDGRAQSIGAVEHLFEAQWMTNHSIKAIKDQLDLASKLIFQTSDGNFIGQNVLSAIETGDILIHSINQPLTLLNNKADITALQSFSSQWQVLGKEIVATPEAISGGQQPSGTAWRAIEAQRQEAHSLFELMTENKGLHIEEIMREFIIPHLKKKLDTTEELTAILDSEQLSQFDALYVPNEAIRRDNDQIKKTILSGEVAQNLDRSLLENDIKQELVNDGNQRFVRPDELDSVTWKKVLKDLEWEVSVDVTSEETDKTGVLETLTTAFQTIASLAGRPMTPNEQLLFNSILEKTDAISPLQLSQTPQTPQAIPQSTSLNQQPIGGGSNVEQLAKETND